jgi:hypothetical protein
MFTTKSQLQQPLLMPTAKGGRRNATKYSQQFAISKSLELVSEKRNIRATCTGFEFEDRRKISRAEPCN